MVTISDAGRENKVVVELADGKCIILKKDCVIFRLDSNSFQTRIYSPCCANKCANWHCNWNLASTFFSVSFYFSVWKGGKFCREEKEKKAKTVTCVYNCVIYVEKWDLVGAVRVYYWLVLVFEMGKYMILYYTQK